MRQPEVIQQLAALGNEPGGDLSPEQFGEFLRAEATKWAKLAALAKLKLGLTKRLSRRLTGINALFMIHANDPIVRRWGDGTILRHGTVQAVSS